MSTDSKHANNTSSPKTITLAGGGLVGSLLSLILARKGYQVEVFESRPDMRKEDISAGRSINLALANRGIKPLDDLGLMPKINEMLIPMRGRMVHIEGEQDNFQAYGQQADDVIYSISRGQLNSFLMTEAENTGLVNFHFNHKITHVDFENNQFTLEHNRQSSVHGFEHLIGTDGANSQVRKAILDQGFTENSEQPLDHSYKELCIPADSNDKHKIDKNALHIWPRGEFMLIALPNLDGSFTVTLFMPNQGETSFESITNQAQINQFFEHYFADVKPLLDPLSETFLANPTGKLATIKCAPWSFKDKALIIGDAAHAVVPFHGQGMNCGFEDCDIIATLLPKNEDSDAFDWQMFFSQVDQHRKVNADAIADMALENYIEMRDSVRKPQFLLQKQLAFQIQQWFPKRFIPRYAMVMFEHIPYSQAFAIGEKHRQLLNELTQSVKDVSQLHQQEAERLLDKYEL
ncbi:FAD-dependent oxidoreductase [Colwelliaceae bacterium 6471]